MSHYQNIAKACVWVTLLMVFDLGSAGAATWSMQPLIAKGCQSYKDFPQVKKKLLDDRNERWIEPLEKILNGDKAVMVVVGAGHLAGENSVVELLEKKGWKIEQLKQP